VDLLLFIWGVGFELFANKRCWGLDITTHFAFFGFKTLPFLTIEEESFSLLFNDIINLFSGLAVEPKRTIISR
jgi:hypothetical protein